jgi:hypothetical protein
MYTRRHILSATAAAALLAAAPLFPAAAQIDIALGQSMEGRFASGDPTLPDQSHYRLYRFRGTPGEPIAVTMRSSDFDAFLAGGSMRADQFAAEDYDDDSAGGTDARIETVVGPDGTYYIRANTLTGGQTGAYTLRVDAGAPGASHGRARSAEIRNIGPGETVQGTFSASDDRLEDDTHFQVYRYRGTPGQQIVVTMRSSDFDAYLIGGVMRGGTPQMTDSDDDGAGGTDARMQGTVGSDGEYYITANTLVPRETGAYTLTVEPAPARGSK